MQKFQPAFIKLQPETLSPFSSVNSRLKESVIKPKYYETQQSENYLEKSKNMVDSIIMENNYFSNQIRQKNATIKLRTKLTPKAKDEDMIKRNIYRVSRLAKTQRELDEKSKQNKAKKIADKPKEDKFTPLLNKKSLVLASKQKDTKRKTSLIRISVEKSPLRSSFRSNESKDEAKEPNERAMFYYDKSKKMVGRLSLNTPKKEAFLKRLEDSSQSSIKSDIQHKPAINKKSKILIEKMGYNTKERKQELIQLHKQRMQFRRELSNALKEQREEDEIRECSFKPKINRSGSITYDSKVEKRLLHWDKARKIRLESLNKQMLDKEARMASRPKKNKIRDDLSFISKESVQKSLSKFLYWKDYSKKKQKDKDELKAKFCLLRSNV